MLSDMKINFRILQIGMFSILLLIIGRIKERNASNWVNPHRNGNVIFKAAAQIFMNFVVELL